MPIEQYNMILGKYQKINSLLSKFEKKIKSHGELNYKQKIWREINLLYSEIKEVSIKNPEYSCLPCVCLSDVYNKIQLIKEDISFWEKMIPIP